MTEVKTRKKLIEVALPLDAINQAAAREKSIRHGHPSTLHLWWARRPLAAARAVIWSQMVDDPSSYVDDLLGDPKLRRRADRALAARHEVWEQARATAERAARGGIAGQVPSPGAEPTLEEVAAELERERLFDILRELVKWESTTNEEVLERARAEIWQSRRRACADNAGHPRAKELFDRNKLPAFHDPFAGGGALPLEAQRLGLEAYASDLNPVAVLINKAMIEIPPRFAGRPPVNPEARAKLDHGKQWRGAQGLAEDVRYYGRWMRDGAEKRIGHLYPPVEVTAEMARERPDLKPYVGRKLTVIAWLWARTVKSPNPAFAHVGVPLASTFMLSTKAGKEAYVEPVIEGDGYRFVVKVGKPKDVAAAKSGTKLGRGANFRCVMSGAPIVVDDQLAHRTQADSLQRCRGLRRTVRDRHHARLSCRCRSSDTRLRRASDGPMKRPLIWVSNRRSSTLRTGLGRSTPPRSPTARRDSRRMSNPSSADGWPIFMQFGGHAPIDPSWHGDAEEASRAFLKELPDVRARAQLSAVAHALEALRGVEVESSLRPERDALMTMLPLIKAMQVEERSEDAVGR